LLSGFATPVESMPAWLQTVTLINPLRHILVILRGVFLRGMPSARAPDPDRDRDAHRRGLAVPAQRAVSHRRAAKSGAARSSSLLVHRICPTVRTLFGRRSNFG
jgi:hypothetical protein